MHQSVKLTDAVWLHDVCELSVAGFPGITVDGLVAHHLEQTLKFYTLNIVIRESGGNYLDRHGVPGTYTYVARNVNTIMKILLEQYKDKIKVIWCQALKRGKTRHKLLEVYNDDVFTLNGFLATEIEHSKYPFCYWTNMGFWNVSVTEWTSDNIHLTTPNGRQEYFRSIAKIWNILLLDTKLCAFLPVLLHFKATPHSTH